MLRTWCVVLALWGGQVGAEDQLTQSELAVLDPECSVLADYFAALVVCYCASKADSLERLQCYDELGETVQLDRLRAEARARQLGLSPFGRAAMQNYLNSSE